MTVSNARSGWNTSTSNGRDNALSILPRNSTKSLLARMSPSISQENQPGSRMLSPSTSSTMSRCRYDSTGTYLLVAAIIRLRLPCALVRPANPLPLVRRQHLPLGEGPLVRPIPPAVTEAAEREDALRDRDRHGAAPPDDVVVIRIGVPVADLHDGRVAPQRAPAHDVQPVARLRPGGL